MTKDSKLAPGHYVVTPDPDGELRLMLGRFGLRVRVVKQTPDPPREK